MEFTVVSAILILSNTQPNFEHMKSNSSPICAVINKKSKINSASLACNIDLIQIDDKDKIFLQDYIKKNNIEEIKSVDAGWTEGTE